MTTLQTDTTTHQGEISFYWQLLRRRLSQTSREHLVELKHTSQMYLQERLFLGSLQS